MIAKIFPSNLRGTVTAPPSKSMAHRHLICAALADGDSVVHGISDSKDIKATVGALRALGCDIRIENETAYIRGIPPANLKSHADLFVNESGSTLRFFIPICLLTESPSRLYGKKRLFERPLGIYEDICQKQGLLFRRSDCELTVAGTLSAGEYKVPGNISSQFISGLLFALPCLTESSVIHITETTESLPYLRMTMEVLREHGVDVFFNGTDRLQIPGGQSYRAGEYAVEGDYSNAAFFEAMNVLGGEVKVIGLKPDSLQGDKVYQEYFSALKQENATLDIRDCPDLAPVLMAVAAARNGATLTGTNRLRIKESDRGSVMAAELAKFGAKTMLYEDEIRIEKAVLCAPTEALESHGDHRIVMALSVLCTLYGGEIHGAEDVSKSFPDFFERFSSLGAKVEIL